MTCREKLRLEHPDKINPSSWGGCERCPSTYGYLPDPDICGNKHRGEKGCIICWDREIPEEKGETDMITAYVPRKTVDAIDLNKAGEAAKKASESISKSTDALSCLAGIRANAEKAGGKESGKEKGSLQKLGESAKKIAESAVKAVQDMNDTMTAIKDSGDRTEFETGAVRDMREGKGRCDLMPLEVVSRMIDPDGDTILDCIADFQKTRDTEHLYDAINTFTAAFHNQMDTLILEVAKHFEEGAKKYGENNWQKGIPVHCYIDSAVRHYLKWLRGDTDEPHDRAFVWNLMCCIWEVDYRMEDCKSDAV